MTSPRHLENVGKDKRIILKSILNGLGQCQMDMAQDGYKLFSLIDETQLASLIDGNLWKS
jgi:hypothetical protein